MEKPPQGGFSFGACGRCARDVAVKGNRRDANGGSEGRPPGCAPPPPEPWLANEAIAAALTSRAVDPGKLLSFGCLSLHGEER
jgi:hypothetical protein